MLWSRRAEPSAARPPGAGKRGARAIYAGLAILGTLGLLLCAGVRLASDQLLFPTWKGASKDFSVCPPALAAAWGEACGNMRLTRSLRFSEVMVPSGNGYGMPGWLIRAEDNGKTPADGAILLIHGGGSDRREVSRHVPFFLAHRLDVLAIDLGCHGEAPCPVPGLTYGHRESQDVLSAYLYLLERYPRVVAMGSSVGAAAVLIALPSMPRMTGVIVENPMASFERLIHEAPAAHSIPRWFSAILIEVTEARARFSGTLSPEHALPLVKSTRIYFIHSKQDEIVPYQQSQRLAASYTGPKTVWWPDRGGHSAIWDADRAAYEARLATFLDSLRGG
jgi:pimeloyl-ACP methyl ester carboxylesterase